MTAKEYVSQLIGINARIREAELTLSSMQAERDQLGAMRYDSVRVSGGQSSDLGDAVIRKKEDIDRQVKKIERLRETKQTVEDTVGRIKDGRYATLLLLRYEHCCSWRYITEVLSTPFAEQNEDTIRKVMHGQALMELDKILKN